MQPTKSLQPRFEQGGQTPNKPEYNPFSIIEEQKTHIDRTIEAIYFGNKYRRVFDIYEATENHSLTVKERVESASRIKRFVTGIASCLWGLVKKIVCVAWYVFFALRARKKTEDKKILRESVFLAPDEQKLEEYWKWRERAIKQGRSPDFKEILLDERLGFNDFICPITKKLIICPYRTKDGKVFERVAVISWVQEHKKKKESAMYKGEMIRESELIYDWEYHRKLVNHFNANKESISEKDQEGLKAFTDVVSRASQFIRIKLLEMNTRMNLSSQITDDMYKERNNALLAMR